MSKGQDHSADEKLPPPPPIEDMPDPSDPSILPPPPPPKPPIDPMAALAYSIIVDLTGAVEMLAGRVPGGFVMSRRLDSVKASLETLRKMAHDET